MSNLRPAALCAALILSGCGDATSPHNLSSGLVTSDVLARLSFTTQPQSTAAGEIMSPVQVTVRGVSSTTRVTLRITNASNLSGAVLGGTVSKSAVGGVATFSDLYIDKPQAGYRLRATTSDPLTTLSVPFDITVGAPAPILMLSATARSFTGVAGGSNPTAQTVSITNAGVGTLDVAVGPITYGTLQPIGWLAASLDAATAPATLTLSTTLGDLPAGTYTATVPVAGNATNSPQNVAVTLTVTPPPTPGTIFASDWSTALGMSNTAKSDGGKWDLSIDGGGPANRIEVVPATGLGFPTNMPNVLKVLYDVANENSYWNVQALDHWTLPPIGSAIWFRIYIRNDIGGTSSGGATRPIQTGPPGSCHLTHMVGMERTGTTGLSLSINNETSGNSHVWRVSPELQRQQTYRLEYQYTRQATNAWTLHARIYDEAGNLIRSDADFYDNGGSTTLATYSGTITSGTDCLLNHMIGYGQEPGNGSPDPAHQQIYYGGFAVSLSDWIGPYGSSAPPAPVIALSQTSRSFAAVAGGEDPPFQVIDIANSGTGTLNVALGPIAYGASQPTGWLGASLGSTSAPSTLTLTPVVGSLPAGTYTATVPITGNAINSPQDIAVTFVVSAPPVPSMVVAPTSRSFAAVAGGSNPAPTTVSVTNGGTGTMDVALGTISYGASQPTGWLAASLSTATAPSTLTLTATVGSLGAGTYTATIPITSSTAGNSPQNVTATFVVSPAPVPSIVLSPTSRSFAGTVGGSNPAAQTISVTNGGSGALDVALGPISYGASQPTGWLVATLNSASAPSTLTLAPTLGSLAAGTYTATVPVTSVSAPNSPQIVAVTFTVSPASTPGNLVWASAWSTATGTSSAAKSDGGKWDLSVDGGGPTNRLEVVSATGLDFPSDMANVLKVLNRFTNWQNDYWNVLVQNGWQLPPIGGSLNFRLYFRYDIGAGTGGDQLHAVQTGPPGNCPYTAELMFGRASATTFRFSIATYGGSSSGGGNAHEWRLNFVLNREVTYRIEEQYIRQGTNTWKAHARLYDSNDNLIASDANFADTYGSGTTLATYSGNITSATDCFRNKMIGFPNQNGGSDDAAHQHIYYGGFAVSHAGWIGPYVAGEKP